MNTKRYNKAGLISIIIGIAFLSFWLTHIKPATIDRNNLTTISGTLKKIPQYERGSGGDPGAVFELNEYDKTIFGIPSGLYEVLDKNIFTESKLNDSVFFLIENRIYQKRLNHPNADNFFTRFPDGDHIQFYDLVFKEKNYLPLDSFNKKVIENNTLKNIICGFIFLLICLKIYTDFRPRGVLENYHTKK